MLVVVVDDRRVDGAARLGHLQAESRRRRHGVSTTPPAGPGSASTSSAGTSRSTQISTYFKDAVIAVEDHRYYLHPGHRPDRARARGVLRTCARDGTQGGSTITQQLARTLFLSNAQTYGRKAKEAALAVMLEVFLSKREILELYLNRVFLSGGIYGVETMSQKMLRKPASQLTLAEAALIAGIIRAPATYSPWHALRRRAPAQLRRAAAHARGREDHRGAGAGRARGERIRIQPPPSVVERAARLREGVPAAAVPQRLRRRQPARLEGPHDVRARDAGRRRSRGPRRAAPAAASRVCRRRSSRIDPQTGNLLAMVGGSDFATTPFNRAVRSRRQPGSAFKPFVYAAALERGLSPVSMIRGLAAGRGRRRRRASGFRATSGRASATR